MAVVAHYFTHLSMQMQSEDFIGHQPYVVEDSYHESTYEGNIAVKREGQ